MYSDSAKPAKDIDLEPLFEKIKERDLEALESLYSIVRIPVYNFALSIVKNVTLAEDTLHDVILKVYHSIHSYKSNTKPMSWILTITKNEALMKLRKENRISYYSEDIIENMSSRSNFTEEDKILLEASFELLDDKERSIVVLHTLTGLKHREIASILKLPLATVLSKYNRSLKKLKKIMEEGA